MSILKQPAPTRQQLDRRHFDELNRQQVAAAIWRMSAKGFGDYEIAAACRFEEYDLPTKPRKISDRRSLHIESTVEAEAIPAGVLRELLRENIEDLLPHNALEVADVPEESEREHIERMADILEGAYGETQ